MRLNKITLSILTLMLIGLAGALYSYNTYHNNKQVGSQENTPAGESTIRIDTSPNSQTIELYSPSTQNSNGATQGSQTTNKTPPPSSYSQPTYHSANLEQYLPPSYSSTPMPSFDFGRSSPTLQVPPQPNCGANADSSYYANCMDAYCRSYPYSSYCLNR